MRHSHNTNQRQDGLHHYVKLANNVMVGLVDTVIYPTQFCEIKVYCWTSMTISSPVLWSDRHDNQLKIRNGIPPLPPPPQTTPIPHCLNHTTHHTPTPYHAILHPVNMIMKQRIKCRIIIYYKYIFITSHDPSPFGTGLRQWWHMFILLIQKHCLWLTEWTFHVMLAHIPTTAGANVWREPRGHGPYIDVLIMVRGWNIGHTLDTISFQTERYTLSCSNYFMQNWNLFLKCVINML